MTALAACCPWWAYLPWFVLIPVVAFFLLKDGAAFRRDILLALPRGRLRGRGAEVFEDINDALAGTRIDVVQPASVNA